MTRRKNLYTLWAVIPALLVYTVFAVIPLGISLVLSFTDWNIERLFSPDFVGVKNYLTLAGDSIFLRAIKNTFLFAFLTTLLKLLTGPLLALALVQRLPGRGLFRTIFYAPCVLSITVVGVLFKAILANKGLLNNTLRLLGLGSVAMDWLARYSTAMGSVMLVEIWMWSGFNMFIFIAGLQAISDDYYESAALDGATAWQKFFHITLPLLMPSITVVTTLSISGGLKVFDIIYVITNGGPGFDTQVLSTYTYQSFSYGFLGESAAGSVILAVLVMLISYFINHLLTRREEEV